MPAQLRASLKKSEKFCSTRVQTFWDKRDVPSSKFNSAEIMKTLLTLCVSFIALTAFAQQPQRPGQQPPPPPGNAPPAAGAPMNPAQAQPPGVPGQPPPGGMPPGAPGMSPAGPVGAPPAGAAPGASVTATLAPAESGT